MEIDNILKITLSLIALGVGYHKYMLSLLEKKIDKEVWEREKNLFLRLQSESGKALNDSLCRIENRIARIEEKLMG